MNNQSFTQ